MNMHGIEPLNRAETAEMLQQFTACGAPCPANKPEMRLGSLAKLKVYNYRARGLGSRVWGVGFRV